MIIVVEDALLAKDARAVHVVSRDRSFTIVEDALLAKDVRAAHV